MALERTISELNALVGSLNATGSMEGAIIGVKGDKGQKGDTGDTGNGIQSVTKTSTSGLVDTYTILYTDGTTSTFAVTNGEDGTDGVDGRDGVDGHSPTITTSRVGNTVTILSDGESIGTVQDGADGTDGQDGQDGHTPTITASKTDKVTTVYADGVAIATINDGVDGQGAVTDVTVNGVTVMDGNVAKVIVPTKVSDLSNDSGFITSETDPVFTASAAHGISSSDISAWNAKQNALGTITITLTVEGWSNNAQTVTATGVTASNTVIVSPVPSAMSDYVGGGIVCTAQGANTLTFECGITPTSAIDVNVVIV